MEFLYIVAVWLVGIPTVWCTGIVWGRTQMAHVLQYAHTRSGFTSSLLSCSVGWPLAVPMILLSVLVGGLFALTDKLLTPPD